MSARIHSIAGAGGVALHVRDWGPLDAPPVLLIHGWSQCHLCWARQYESDLIRDHRLIALDLRGHGMSEKPLEAAAYAEGAAWAGDIAAIIDVLALQRPVLAGWSYGGRVIGEYLSAHQDAALGGIALAGAIFAIGAARANWMVGPASPGVDRDLYTDDLPRRLTATARFVANCSASPLDPQTLAEFTGFNMLVPPHVRRAMFAADRDLRPAFAASRCPALIVHGADDLVVSSACADAFANVLPQARKLILPDTGHIPFFEQPARFNDALRALVAEAREHA